MKRLFFPFLVVLVSFLIGYHILSVWQGISLYQTNPLKERFLKATRLNPSNPDPYYRLGLFYQRDIHHIDLKESLQNFIEAIKRNPLEQQYYLNLARVLQKLGEKDGTNRSLEKAGMVFPTSYQGRWVAGNLLLQQGDLEKALPHFSYILSNYPNQSDLVYDVLMKVVDHTDFILEKVVPKDLFSMNRYLAFLYEIGEKESAKEAWQKKVAYGMKSDRAETLRHIEFLIRHGDLQEAFQTWRARIREEGIPIPSDGNLITNGGFETKDLLGSGFDWKMTDIPGAEISFDPSMAFEGKISLKIVFNGKENINFSHVSQIVPLSSNKEYILKAYMKTKAITTQSGLKIEISGIGPEFYGASESLSGDNGWTELTVTFRTPPQSQGGRVTIRRKKTEKFDRFISGTVWIDNVSLKER